MHYFNFNEFRYWNDTDVYSSFQMFENILINSRKHFSVNVLECVGFVYKFEKLFHVQSFCCFDAYEGGDVT